jgi:adenylate cyclase
MRTLAHTLFKRPVWLFACVSALAVVLMAAISALFGPQLQQWEERLASRTWALADSSATERRVVVIDIDEKSTQALGAWPWPRDRMAQLLTGLDAYGVNLKVVDVLFDGEQNPAQDAKLVEALQTQNSSLNTSQSNKAPTVISQLFALSPEAQVKSGLLAGSMDAGAASTANASIPTAANTACPAAATQAFGYMAAAPAFAQSSQAVGHITPVVDPDGSIRRVPAVVCFEGKAYPALAVAGLAAATGAQPVIKAAPGLMHSGQVLDVGGLQIPVDAKGQLRVSYQMPRAGFVSMSAVDVIQGKVPAHMLKGAWALVGSTAFGGGDAVPTPQGGAVGGVEVHAQILSAALDGRSPFTPAWAPLWPIATGALALLVLIFSLKASGPKAAVVVPAVALASGAVIFGAHAVLLLGAHQWLGWGQPVLFVALAATLLTAAEMLRVRSERESLFQNLSSYLPEGAARRVAFEEPTAQVVAETREATVMLVDLRNFSAYCEERTPEDAATVLHIFYTTVEKIVTEHGGVVEQMVGDGLTAVWNGSSPCEHHALQALKAAKVIWQEGVAQLPKVASRKTPPLDIGIGIESGPVMVGSFGPARRRVHTVMGEAVSVASRLEKLTAELGYPVLVGPKALAQCKNAPDAPDALVAQDTQKLGDFLLSGMRAPRTVYALNVPIDPSHLQLVSSMEAGAVG